MTTHDPRCTVVEAHSDPDCNIPADILFVTVRIEVPVIFDFPADPDKRERVTWDALYATAISTVTDLMPPALTAVADIEPLRGPGSTGHYTAPWAEDKIAEPHLTAEFPAAPEVEA